MANGTATDFTYDAASQLLDIITEKVGTSEVIESIAYTYNNTPMELRRGFYRTDTHHYHNDLN